jgi:hypothetical protein
MDPFQMEPPPIFMHHNNFSCGGNQCREKGAFMKFLASHLTPEADFDILLQENRLLSGFVPL